MNTFKSILLLVAVCFFAVGCATKSPTAKTGPDAEATFDGLYEYENTRVDVAWAEPDLDLSGYWKIIPVNLGIEYRDGRNSRSLSMKSSWRSSRKAIDSKS
jgi:hypothetical protein